MAQALARGAAAALAVIAIASCSKEGSKEGSAQQGAAAVPAKISVGATLPLTGAEARIGGFFKEGYELAFEELKKQAGLEVGGVDGRSGEAAFAQSPRHGNERLHILGKVGEPAVRQAGAQGWPVGPARRIHQDDAPLARDEALVSTRRRVALHRPSLRRAEPGLVEKAADCGQALDPRSEGAVPC
jgi:hypothetical protein